MNKFYLTTAIPYVNAKPHIGHALEFVQADVVARFHKIQGEGTLLLSGGDENALKNVQAAEKENMPIQEFVDKNSQLFYDLAEKLNINFDVFQKGSDAKHHSSSQKLWQLCFAEGDIYKKEYKGLYCVGCELFYERDELDENGECYEHPGKKLEEVAEENYFFRLSKYQDQIEKLIKSDELKIIPESRKNEALSFIKQELKDISISRSNERAKNWGVPVPDDPTQHMYVWFDALNIYQSGIGYGWNEEKYNKWWPADLHVIGKGILRFHAIYWPAFLLSAGLALPKSIFVHGYLTVNGQKMSKTVGNVVDPLDLIEKYGTDALRYYLLREIPAYGDGDFSESRLKAVYNADLANGLGNLVARVAKLCEKSNFSFTQKIPSFGETLNWTEKTAWYNSTEVKDPTSLTWLVNFKTKIENFQFNEVLTLIYFELCSRLDQQINKDEPWKLLTNGNLSELNKKLDLYVRLILTCAILLQPFLPDTSKKIEEQFKGPKITSQEPLFPRI